MGRPSTFTPEVFEAICLRLSIGEPLAAICRDEGMPGLRTVYDWMEGDEDLTARFARARDEGYDAIAEECLRIADEPPPVNGQGTTDSGHVAWAKHRTETRLKLLAKWNPKKYGDKVDVTGQIGVNVNVVNFGDSGG